jgi:ABC-type dipeptide/oligopeptide/nickel transport system permease subunit
MNAQQQNLQQVRSLQAGGKFFGIPLGDLGFFTSVLMAVALGFIGFFLFTFLAIFGVMIYNGMGHQVDYAVSYKYIAFPAGCVVLIASLIFFATLWLRRKVSRG